LWCHQNGALAFSGFGPLRATTTTTRRACGTPSLPIDAAAGAALDASFDAFCADGDNGALVMCTWAEQQRAGAPEQARGKWSVQVN